MRAIGLESTIQDSALQPQESPGVARCPLEMVEQGRSPIGSPNFVFTELDRLYAAVTKSMDEVPKDLVN